MDLSVPELTAIGDWLSDPTTPVPLRALLCLPSSAFWKCATADDVRVAAQPLARLPGKLLQASVWDRARRGSVQLQVGNRVAEKRDLHSKHGSSLTSRLRTVLGQDPRRKGEMGKMATVLPHAPPCPRPSQIGRKDAHFKQVLAWTSKSATAANVLQAVLNPLDVASGGLVLDTVAALPPAMLAKVHRCEGAMLPQYRAVQSWAWCACRHGDEGYLARMGTRMLSSTVVDARAALPSCARRPPCCVVPAAPRSSTSWSSGSTAPPRAWRPWPSSSRATPRSACPRSRALPWPSCPSAPSRSTSTGSSDPPRRVVGGRAKAQSSAHCAAWVARTLAHLPPHLLIHHACRQTESLFLLNYDAFRPAPRSCPPTERCSTSRP